MTRMAPQLLARAGTRGHAAATSDHGIPASRAASSLAVRLAEQSGLTLVGWVRDGAGTIYTRPDRIELSRPD